MSSKNKVPTVGRFVNYIDEDAQVRKGTITSVGKQFFINIIIRDKNNNPVNKKDVAYDIDAKEKNSWHWPQAKEN